MSATDIQVKVELTAAAMELGRAPEFWAPAPSAAVQVLAAAGIAVSTRECGKWHDIPAASVKAAIAALTAAGGVLPKKAAPTKLKSGVNIADWVKDSLGLEGGQYGHYTLAEYTADNGVCYYANMTIRVADHNMNPANNRGAGVLSIVCQDDINEVGKFQGAGFYAQAHLNPSMTKREMMAEIERAFKFVAELEIAELEKEVNGAGVKIARKVVVDRVKDIRKLS